MEENLKIIQEIMLRAIQVNQQQNMSVEFDFHSASNKLTISICTNPNPTFNDELTRRWWVSVKNTEMLKEVLKEIKSLETPIEDFLGD
ncbi:MAG: hypothetical protein ACLSTJ_07910 [Clostridium neonatale]